MRSPLAPVRMWPADARQQYRRLGYWTDETFPQFLEDRAARFAELPAVLGNDAAGTAQQWTYAELATRARHAARRFSRLGIAPGDRVVVALPNTVEYLEAVLGLFRLGALPVFALPTHRELELGQFCEFADAAALVVSRGADRADHDAIYAAVSERMRGAGLEPPLLVDVNGWPQEVRTEETETDLPMPAVGSEEIAFLQLSGGTTGVSKLIPRTHADYLYSVRASAEICGTSEHTRMLVALPAAHNFPMSSPGILGVLHAGGAVVLAPDPSPRTAFALIATHRVTTAALVPPLAQAWIAAAQRRTPPDLSSLETVQVGGARLSDTIAPEVRTVLCARLQQVFGMAEGLVNYTRDDDPEQLVLTTQGRPMSEHDEIRVVDEHDNDVPEGAEGSLLVRGPYTIRGYYRSPQADADSFTTDGFYRTGDLVRRQPTGHLVVTGRDKDQVNRAGEKVSTEELEDIALTHPGVRDAVVVGVPDRYLGERVVLVAQPEQPGDEPDLLAHLRAAGLAAYKIPDRVVLLDALPATHVGKNSRRELRRVLFDYLEESP